MAKEFASEVEVKTRDSSYTGILLPSEKGFINLKLKSGYNIGLNKKEVISIRVLSRASKAKVRSFKHKQNPKLPTIAILHTGGTLASKVDYRTGGVTAKFKPEELLEYENISANAIIKIVRNLLFNV